MRTPIYSKELRASYTPAPDIRAVVLAEDQVIWTGPYHYSVDRAAEQAAAKVIELNAERCVHCGRYADFIEVTDYGLLAWCSIYEAEAFYKDGRI